MTFPLNTIFAQCPSLKVELETVFVLIWIPKPIFNKVCNTDFISVKFASLWALITARLIFSEMGFSVVMTSDHGSIRVQNDVMVSADRTASSGVRYKYGRNINTNPKNALVIRDPKEYRLPEFGPQPTYVIAKNDNYFVYPNEAHKYQGKFSNSFQHGGISMEEMIVPVAIMESRLW